MIDKSLSTLKPLHEEKYLLIKVLVLLSIAILCIVLRLHSLEEPLERDITTYAFVAHEILGNKALYIDIFDHKPPGVFWAYMAAEMIFGYEPHAVIYMGMIFTLISLLFLFLFIRRIAGTTAGLIGAFFWAIASNALFLEASQPNVELFLNTFTIFSLWSFSKYLDGRRCYLVLTGFVLALATAFKMIAVFPLASLVCYLAYDNFISRKNDLAAFALSFVMLTAPVVILWIAIAAYFIIAGSFSVFYEAVFEFSRAYSGGIFSNTWNYFTTQNLFFSPHLTEIAVLGYMGIAWLLLGLIKRGGKRAVEGDIRIGRGFFILITIGIMVALASPGKYWPHYYQLLLPVIAITSALLISELHEIISAKNASAAIAVSAIIFIIASALILPPQFSYLKLTPDELSLKKYRHSLFIDSRIVGKQINSITTPCDTIYEVGTESGLYYYSKRSSASPIFLLSHVFVGSEAQGMRRIDKILSDIETNRPAVFVWYKKSGRLEAGAFGPLVERNYTELRGHGNFRIFEIKEKRSNGDCLK